MKTAWQTWVWAGSFSLAALMTVGAVADDPPTDEPPVAAEKPDEAPAVAPAASVVPPPAYGVAPVPAAVVAAPSVVGDYRVGYIHRPVLSRLFWYSAYHPFLDELHSPIADVVYNGGHAGYYAGYRQMYTAETWSTYYVPQTQCYAPGAYGYTASPAPTNPSAVPVNGVQYTNGPSVYAPYGAGSALYFGAYGPASY